MGVFKNGLKKILPPPVNSFMREVNRIITMEEQNRKLIMQLQDSIEKQNQKLIMQLQDSIEKQNQLLQQKNKEIEWLEQNLRYSMESMQELKDTLWTSLNSEENRMAAVKRDELVHRDYDARMLASDFADWEPDFADDALDVDDGDFNYDEFDFDEE